ncbi:hypothetical protein O181_048437 [Austropuccinia psidii MF-1]|uniref:Uncharacterized protein n=1 Tax=Austropuccinia psidii MF-1 TaxID=1389203 RepID=A0A9Q3HLM6_9BASI|nr:hypothetical protein [Austropuccinia psidii MF-1]
MPRNSTPLTKSKPSLKESLTPFLGENSITEKDSPKSEEWATFSGEGAYRLIEFIRRIYMFQEDFKISNYMIVDKLHPCFTRTSKKWYSKMRQDHGKHDWFWWKS